MFSNVRINGAERVVQEVIIGVTVHGTGKGDPLFLSTGQVDTYLKYIENKIIIFWLNIFKKRMKLDNKDFIFLDEE